jgi:hypothetical protein
MISAHSPAFRILRMIFMGWSLGAWVAVVLIAWVWAKAVVRSLGRRRRLASLTLLRNQRRARQIDRSHG